VLLAGAVTCTVVLDRNSIQCSTDADCAAQFAGRPTCNQNYSVCVASGLQPLNCFLASADNPPTKDEDFLNACTVNYIHPAPSSIRQDTCLSVDNCNSAGLCADGGADAGPLTAPPTPDAGASPGGGGADAGATVLPPNCQDAVGGPVIHITGSSNFPPLLDKLTPIIKGTGLTPVFRTTDSCTGAGSMVRMSSGAFTSAHFMRDPTPGPAAVYAQYYDEAGRHNCTVGPSGVEVDIGESEISAETCGLTNDPLQVLQSPGAILPMLFVTPGGSMQRAISAEVARQVLGNGGIRADGMAINPWSNPAFFLVRGSGTATTRLIGKAIDVPVPPNKLWGTDQGQAETLATNLGRIVAEADGAIGILGADAYDQHRDSLKVLAFQAKRQLCAFNPDANSNLAGAIKDKINVRDGHYPIWGTLHFFAATGPDLTPISEAAGLFLPPFNPNAAVAENVLNAFIDASWIPECAMMVRRDQDLSPLRVNHPVFPCGCLFDAHVNGGMLPANSPCKPCESAADCHDPARPACSYHYCEAAGE
jgi:hypothetical protein